MARVAVFDSGLGSLSVVRAVQRAAKSEIVYFADQQSFPYGSKSKQQLGRIIERTVRGLREEFDPDVIVMASNTPSLMFGNRWGVIGVYPPVGAAAQISATNNIAILGTRSAVASRGLDSYIAGQGLPRGTTIHKIDASELVELVETGKFLTDGELCKKKIRGLLAEKFRDHAIDAATLSSTHLPFLRPFLESELDGVRFLDPAEAVASDVAKRAGDKGQNTLKIYTSGDVKKFQENLAGLGIKNKASRLTF